MDNMLKFFVMVLLTSVGALYSCCADTTVAPPDDVKDKALLPISSHPSVLWDVDRRTHRKVQLVLPPEKAASPAETPCLAEDAEFSIFAQCASEGDFKAYYDFVKGMKKERLTRFFSYWPDSTIFLSDLDAGGALSDNTLGAFKQALFEVIGAADITTPIVGVPDFTGFKRDVELIVLLAIESHIKFFELVAPSCTDLPTFGDDLQLCDYEEFKLLRDSITSDPSSPLKDPTVQGVFASIRSIVES